MKRCCIEECQRVRVVAESALQMLDIDLGARNDGQSPHPWQRKTGSVHPTDLYPLNLKFKNSNLN